MNDRNSRRAFALADFLTSLFIVAGGLALLGPAALNSEEAARRLACSQNLREIHTAVFKFEAAHTHFPQSQYRPTYGDAVTAEYLYWPVKLLPYFANKPDLSYDVSVTPWHENNQKLANTPMDVWTCPSDPTRGKTAIFHEPGIADTENAGIVGCYTLTDWSQSRLGPPGNENGTGALCAWNIRRPPLVSKASTRANFTDGMAQTILATENSAPGHYWVKRKLVSDKSNPGGMWRAQWIGNRRLTPATFTADGSEYKKSGVGECAINCSNHNWAGVYSFHEGGVNSVMMDGSVRFFSEELNGNLLFALVSRDGGELINDEDF